LTRRKDHNGYLRFTCLKLGVWTVLKILVSAPGMACENGSILHQKLEGSLPQSKAYAGNPTGPGLPNGRLERDALGQIEASLDLVDGQADQSS